MKSALLVPFGLKDGQLYEPTQVDNGKACNCVCPACKKPLVAKQKAKTPHFAHAQDENCSKGQETAVHLAVKQIITAKKEIRLPALVWENPSPRKNEIIPLYVERIVRLESVVLEQVVNDFKPDIIAQSDGYTYLVEVAVTHFIDEKKQGKINKNKIPAFEIDTSKLKAGFTMAALERLLFVDKDYPAKWKYHPRLEELTLKASKAEADRIEKIEEEDRERQRKFDRYKNFSPEDKLKANLKSIGLTRRQMQQMTSFVAWEGSFGVPRIIWQSAVLAYIARVQKEMDFCEDFSFLVNSCDCAEWMGSVFEINPAVKNGEKIAIWKYFKHLEKLGILEFWLHQDFYVVVGKYGWPLISG